VEQPLVGLVEFGGEIGNQREVELVDGIIMVIDLTQEMEVILNNAYFR
jgi:hypothetical protein